MNSSGTISGTLTNVHAKVVKNKGGFWTRKRKVTARAVAGLCLAAAIAGGVMEKGSEDQQVQDLQAQVAALQDGTSTGAVSPLDGAVTVGTLKGQSKTQHPKALSPSQHKYKCTKVG